MTHVKFTSIGSFANVYRGQTIGNKPVEVLYGAKIKLHGTNAGIRIESSGLVTPQGRNTDLLESDQYGFGAWVNNDSDKWLHTGRRFAASMGYKYDSVVTIQGEWAGKGIQKNDAVTKLDNKYFFVFSVQVGDEVITDVEFIEEHMPDLDRMLVLPWHLEMDDVVNFDHPASCDACSAFAEEAMKGVGTRDPFIYDVFEVDGVGEGLVFMPMGIVPRKLFGETVFKVKTAEHNVNKNASTKKELVIPENVPAFVENFVTPQRCEQALTEACEGVAETASTGPFLKWVAQDVMKESVSELEDMDLEWKQVQAFVMKSARVWFLNKCYEV